jgi:DNA-binding GntR family transcriptional regulator
VSRLVGTADRAFVGAGDVEACDPERGFCFNKGEAFLDLIMECRWCEGKVVNGGRVMTIQPGQLLGGVAWLAHRWNWTSKTVRVFLDKLQDEGMISRSSPGPNGELVPPVKGNRGGNQVNIITICNYSKYQLDQAVEGLAERLAEGKQGASEGQAKGNIYKDKPLNTGTREQEEDPAGLPATQASPASPDMTREVLLDRLGLSGEVLANLSRLADPEMLKATEEALDRERKKRLKSEQTKAENERRRETAEAAYSLYNKAAAHFGFSLCESCTDKRTAKLLRRIDDIGGLENFRLALRSVGRDDFLMGKKSKPGQPPFRLDFDRLLSTDTGLGDVLARLLDLANKMDRPEDKPTPNGKTWGWWRCS